MTKSELTLALSIERGIPIKIAASIINTIFDSMTDALVEGKHIELSLSNTFVV